jgi:MSHA biogenesis protein MshK
VSEHERKPWRVLAAGALFAAWVAAAATPTVSDPMRPPGAVAQAPERPAEPGAGWVLHSTLVSGSRRSAVINGRVVRPGERVAGARVIAIEPGLARLQTERGPVKLTLHDRTGTEGP